MIDDEEYLVKLTGFDIGCLIGLLTVELANYEDFGDYREHQVRLLKGKLENALKDHMKAD